MTSLSLTRITRLAAFVGLTLWTAVRVLRISFLPAERKLEYGAELMHAWAKRVLTIFAIRVNRRTRNDEEDASARIVVANHVSYLDIAVMLSEGPCLFLAKKEVGEWPLIGRMAKACGIVFVDRDRLADRAQVLRRLKVLVGRGHRVVVFPEGTTSLTGPRRGWVTFFPGVFGLARRTGSSLDLRYLEYSNEERCAWIGDDSFVGHLWRFAAIPKTSVTVRGRRMDPIRDRKSQCRAYHGARNWYLDGGHQLTHFV